MRNPYEALVFLARHEYADGSPRSHEKLMLAATLYAAGASHVDIETSGSKRSTSKGLKIHLPASRSATRVIEQVLAEAVDKRILERGIRQRGSIVHVEWA